jgi:hypothetical protein
LTNMIVQGSIVLDAKFLSRTPLTDKFLYAVDDVLLGRVILFSSFPSIVNRIFVNQISERQSFFQSSIKISPNEKFLAYYNWIQVGGPFSYRYSQIYIYNIERNKEYLLLEHGDENRSNYYFEWGKSSNVVFFERFKKIVKSTFYLPQ